MDSIYNLQLGSVIKLHTITALQNKNKEFAFFEYIRIQEQEDILDAMIFGAIRNEHGDAKASVQTIEINEQNITNLQNALENLAQQTIDINLFMMQKGTSLMQQNLPSWTKNICIVAFSKNSNILKNFSLTTYDHKIYEGDINLIDQLYSNTFYKIPEFLQ